MTLPRVRFTPWLGTALMLCVALPVLGSTQSKTTAKARPKPASATELGPPNKGLGSKNAPIVMEVFSDFQCPSCRNFYETSVRPLLDDYVSTGKVYLIHRDFPLAMHPYSREAARYANAAARIGKFDKVEALLYDKQDVWGRDGKIEPLVATVLTPLEMRQVREMVQRGQLDSFIESDTALGNSHDVRQTPSIFVTHKGTTYPLPPGGVSYTLLKRFLDSLLQGN